MKKLKIGRGGGGGEALIGGPHRRAVLMDGGIALVAGALSSTEEKVLASGRAWGLSEGRNYGSWQQMLEGDLSFAEENRVDFVSVVVPNHLHFPIAHAFVEAGFNVVLDKPMVHSTEQAERLVEAVEEAGVVFAVSSRRSRSFCSRSWSSSPRWWSHSRGRRLGRIAESVNEVQDASRGFSLRGSPMPRLHAHHIHMECLERPTVNR